MQTQTPRKLPTNHLRHPSTYHGYFSELFDRADVRIPPGVLTEFGRNVKNIKNFNSSGTTALIPHIHNVRAAYSVLEIALRDEGCQLIICGSLSIPDDHRDLIVDSIAIKSAEIATSGGRPLSAFWPRELWAPTPGIMLGMAANAKECLKLGNELPVMGMGLAWDGKSHPEGQPFFICDQDHQNAYIIDGLSATEQSMDALMFVMKSAA